MEKSQPPPYSSGPETGYPYPPQNGYPPQYPGYPPQQGYAPQSGYQPQPGYAPQPGYQPQPGHPPQASYIPNPPPQAAPNYGIPQGSQTQREYGWCEDSQRNKPQSNSLAAATFIFTSGGMSLAWSVGFGPAYAYMSNGSRTHMQICWFIAVILGSCIACLLVEKLTKRILNLLAAALVIVNGILFISAPESVTAIIFARYMDGIAFGLTLIPAIMAGSENSVKRFRGLVLSTEQIGLTTGIMLKALYSNLWGYNWDFDTNQMHGILALVYGSLAVLFSFIFTIESPVFFLRKNNEADAVNSLRRLQRPQLVTTETYALLYEHKHLLEEDTARGRAVNVSTGLVPLIKMCLFRGFVSMSFSLPLTYGLTFASRYTVYGDDVWTLYVYGALRLLGVIVAIFTIDTIGRKLPSAISFLVGGGLLIAVGSMFTDYSGGFYDRMDAAVGLLMAYQVFSGIIAPASTCFLGEAFSVSVKPYFLLVVVIFENVLQIIICCSFDKYQDSVSDFGYAVGALQIAFAVFFLIAMPETKKTTLREALAKFKKTIHLEKA